MIFRAMEPFSRHPEIFAVQPVVNPDDTTLFNEAVTGLRHRPPTRGGATRQASVHAGLEALAGDKPDIVLIHDAARPFVTSALISRAIDAAGRTGAAVPAIRRHRHHQADQCQWRGRGDAGSCTAANRADATGVSF